MSGCAHILFTVDPTPHFFGSDVDQINEVSQQYIFTALVITGGTYDRP